MLTNSSLNRNRAWRRTHIVPRHRSYCSTASPKAQRSDSCAAIDRAPIHQSHLRIIPRLHAAHASSHIQGRSRRDFRSGQLQRRQRTTINNVSKCHHRKVTTNHNTAGSGGGSTHVAWLLLNAFIVMARIDKPDDVSRRVGAGLLNVNSNLLACCSLRGGLGGTDVAGCEVLCIGMTAPWVSAFFTPVRCSLRGGIGGADTAGCESLRIGKMLAWVSALFTPARCSLRGGHGGGEFACCEMLSIWMAAPWVSAFFKLTFSIAMIKAGLAMFSWPTKLSRSAGCCCC